MIKCKCKKPSNWTKMPLYNQNTFITTVTKWKKMKWKSVDCGIKIRSAGVAPYLFLHVFTASCITTNHTRICWVYECSGQSEAFRWVIAETPEYCWVCVLSDWILSSSTKCRCTCDVTRASFITAQTASPIITSALTRAILQSMMWSCKCSFIAFCTSFILCLNNCEIESITNVQCFSNLWSC